MGRYTFIDIVGQVCKPLLRTVFIPTSIDDIKNAVIREVPGTQNFVRFAAISCGHIIRQNLGSGGASQT